MALSEEVGSVAMLWRFPVKSMGGEQLHAVEVTERGFLGDRAYALIDKDTGEREERETLSQPTRLQSNVRRATTPGRRFATGANSGAGRHDRNERSRAIT
jgi:uncharacterized protein YcbX